MIMLTIIALVGLIGGSINHSLVKVGKYEKSCSK